MRHAIFLFVLAAGASGCKSVDCGPGTIERNGTCDPADSAYGSATCGAGTVLIGDRCEPELPPTRCDPATTAEQPDPNDPNVTLCVGTGGGGCSGTFACPKPAAGKQTICGQLYDITDNSKFQGAATGALCTGSETTGPCALKIGTYDALVFGANPNDPNAVLANGGVEIDDCGRYRVKDITVPSAFIGLGIDDKNATTVGDPAGITNTTGVATNASPDTATNGLEAWIAPKATTDMWQQSGGPPVSNGVYVGIFRAHKCDATGTCTGDKFANQAGVTFTFMGSPVPPANDFYFQPTQVGHTTIDAAATATGVNGTGLLINANVGQSINYSGTGGLTDTANCRWDTKAAAALPNIVFFQVYRPVNQVGKQCTE